MQILSSHTQAVLDALQCQGRHNSCGPYTTATVINALCATGLEGAALAAEMNRPVFRGILPVVRRIPNWATFPWGMVDVLRQHGLDAHWRIFAGIGWLRTALQQGSLLMPITGEWRPLWSHVMTLLAWDEQQGWGFANTAHPGRQLFWLDDRTFQKRWKAMGRWVVEIRGKGAISDERTAISDERSGTDLFAHR